MPEPVTTMTERVSLTVADGIADVRLNRPDKLNAIDGAMFQALAEVGAAIAADTSVRAVVLSGEGRAFCAGLDFASFRGMAGGSGTGPDVGEAQPKLERFPSGANRAQQAGWVWQDVPVPVIAAVHGFAYGGGLQIALGADIRFVAPDARLSIMEVKWGLIPDMSGTQSLRRLVRLDVAKELTFTGRIIDGREALALGLATHVSDTPRDDAMTLAREIAGRSPHAVRAAKQLWNTTDRCTLEEAFRIEETTQRSLIGTPNQVEAVMANVEKRAPEFTDPA